VLQCAVSPEQCTCSHIITSTECHPYLPDLGPSDFCFFPKLNEFIKGWKLVDNEDVVHTASGWLEEKINSSSTVESGLWNNTGPSAFLLDGTMLKGDKITSTYSVAVSSYELLYAPRRKLQKLLSIYALSAVNDITTPT